LAPVFSTRYFFHIGFMGQAYRGWQRQAKGVSIQAVLESILTSALKEPITVMGCGRTDAQVHASQYFFHADIGKAWDYDLLFRLNKLLPDDIAIFDIKEVGDKCHARFDATLRTYDYFIHMYKDPFLSTLSSLYPFKNLQLDEMRRAAAMLPHYTDYRAWCATPANNRTTICNIAHTALFGDASGDRLRFQISANRFLGKMVRVIVSKLLKVGRGEMSVDEFEALLKTGKTQHLLSPAYPQGLYLSRVIYPYLELEPRPNFSGMLNESWKLIQ